MRTNITPLSQAKERGRKEIARMVRRKGIETLNSGAQGRRKNYSTSRAVQS